MATPIKHGASPPLSGITRSILAFRLSRSAVWFSVLLAALIGMHASYVFLSRIPPSTDEAHYMSGALSIAEGFRSGSLSGAWEGYKNALGFKAPLVCVPAGALLWLFGGLERTCNFSLVLTFAAVGIASYCLFRRCAREEVAALGAGLLLATPMVTGLTHRFYVELLLLLVCVCYLAVLSRNPWRQAGSSALLGLVAGLGVLCKLTFPFLVLPSTLFTIYADRNAIGSSAKRAATFAGRLILAAAVCLAVAGPWYVHHFSEVWKHSKYAAAAESCFYPNWIRMNLSSGPNLFVAAAALGGLLLVGRDLAARRIDGPRRNAWISVLLLGAATAFACAGSVNKATRFSVTWLPAFAILAAAAPDYFPVAAVRKHGGRALLAISVLLSAQISFAFLPLPALRAGDLILFASHYPLNVPGWFDDNHPLDRRDYHLGAIDAIVAGDAARRFGANHRARVRLTEFGLLPNFDYLALTSRSRGRATQYLWWDKVVTTGPDAPEYVVSFKGFREVYPGIHFFEFYPDFAADVASGRVDYEQISLIEGPSGTRILLYARKVPGSLGDKIDPQQGIYIEAERFQRGTASIDNGELGYGTQIGIIFTLKAPTFVEYDVTVPRAGAYQIELRYASGVPRPVRLLLDGAVVNPRAAEMPTGGFGPSEQRWSPVGATDIGAGGHVLRLESDAVFPHIDRILLAQKP